MRQRTATWRAVVICAATTVASAGCTSDAQPRAAAEVSGAAAASETEPTLRIIEANGIKMRIAEMGKGPLVLFLHGFPESWYSWRHQLPALAKAGYRAVAPDLRGYGKSDKPPTVGATTSDIWPPTRSVFSMRSARRRRSSSATTGDPSSRGTQS